MKYATITDLIGKTIAKANVGADNDGDKIIFECTDGSVYEMKHTQDCCESVCLESFSRFELDALAGETIVQAYESSNGGDTKYGSETWTFYTLRTNKTTVNLRWHGESNGYYSESVNLYEVKGAMERPNRFNLGMED